MYRTVQMCISVQINLFWLPHFTFINPDRHRTPHTERSQSWRPVLPARPKKYVQTKDIEIKLYTQHVCLSNPPICTSPVWIRLSLASLSPPLWVHSNINWVSEWIEHWCLMGLTFYTLDLLWGKMYQVVGKVIRFGRCLTERFREKSIYRVSQKE